MRGTDSLCVCLAVTIHSTSVSLPFQRETQSAAGAPPTVERFLVNLIDSPGHVDFSPEVTAALRVTDGALVVVDCVEGVRVQTRTVLRQALTERIKPILFLNKLDRIFLELNMDPEEAYTTLRNTVEQVNAIIATYSQASQGPQAAESKSPSSAWGDVTVWPQHGTVGFGSGLQGWAFTLREFAQLYNDKFGVSVPRMMKKLWGDNFWDKTENKWTTKRYNSKGKANQRGFTKLVLMPLRKLIATIKGGSSTDVSVSVSLPLCAALHLCMRLFACLRYSWRFSSHGGCAGGRGPVQAHGHAH